MPSTDITMHNLIQNYHLFKLDDIIKENESCLIKPDTVLEDDHCETQESTQAQFHTYDKDENFDRDLSHLVIESLVLPSFCEFITTRFYHYEDFDDFPGQFYFTMIIDA